jgi:hypothetical protein
MPTCVNCEISVGITGMMIPKPITSINNVIKIKPIAAVLEEDMLGIVCIYLACNLYKPKRLKRKSFQGLLYQIIKPSFY